MSLIDRRRLIISGLAASAVPGLARAAIPASGRLNFNIFMDNRPFGQYAVTFVNEGDLLKVTTDVHMIFQLLGVTSFQYRHHCEEVWRGGRFTALRSNSSRDNDAGEVNTVSAVRAQYDIEVNTNKGNFVVPADANPLTHWNAGTLGGTLFNPQDGRRLSFVTQEVGHDPFPTATGARLNGVHWMLRGDQQIDEWYDDNGVWGGLRGVLPNKSIMEYRRA